MKWNPLWLNPKVITYLWPFKYIKYDLIHIPTHTDNLYYHTLSHTVNPYYQTLSYTVRERSRETLSYFQGKKQQVINIINDNIFALVVSKFVPYVICQSVYQSLMSFVSQLTELNVLYSTKHTLFAALSNPSCHITGHTARCQWFVCWKSLFLIEKREKSRRYICGSVTLIVNIIVQVFNRVQRFVNQRLSCDIMLCGKGHT